MPQDAALTARPAPAVSMRAPGFTPTHTSTLQAHARSMVEARALEVLVQLSLYELVGIPVPEHMIATLREAGGAGVAGMQTIARDAEARNRSLTS